jgi:hypothetical protein
MKTLKISAARLPPINENALVFNELKQLFANLMPEASIPDHLIKAWPLSIKKKQLSVLEDMMDDSAFDKYRTQLAEEAKERASLQAKSSFTYFNKLPLELRFKVWQYTFESEIQPRVHCIRQLCAGDQDDHQHIFHSNQPVSLITQVCQESRNFYISKTKTKFAFETFINFDTDTIYYYNKEPTRDEWVRFLEYEDTLLIRNLAMVDHVFCNLPRPEEEHFSSQHWEMTQCAAAWRRMDLVFEDNRPLQDIWEDRSLKFRELANREVRNSRAGGYARKHVAFLNRLRGDPENHWAPLEWHYLTIAAKDPEES